MQLRTPVAGRAFAAHSRRGASDCSAVDGTGAAVARSPVRISTPNTGWFHRRCRAPLGEEFLDVAIAQREAQVDPDRMLDDRWRKAVAAVGDFSHRASLPSASLPSYLVTLTKPAGAFFVTRAKSNIDAHRVYSAPTDRAIGILCDQTIVLNGHYTSQHYPEHLRRIRLRDTETRRTLCSSPTSSGFCSI
jgi:hypothetical protein